MAHKENSKSLQKLVFQKDKEQKYFQTWDLSGVESEAV